MSIPCFTFSSLNSSTTSNLPSFPPILAQRLLSRLESASNGETICVQSDFFRQVSVEPIEHIKQQPRKRKLSINNQAKLVSLKISTKIRKLLSTVPENARTEAYKELEEAVTNITNKYRPVF